MFNWYNNWYNNLYDKKEKSTSKLFENCKFL